MMDVVTITLCLLQVAYLLTVIVYFGHRKTVHTPVLISKQIHAPHYDNRETLVRKLTLGRRK
jgi:hypothetical protein